MPEYEAPVDGGSARIVGIVCFDDDWSARWLPVGKGKAADDSWTTMLTAHDYRGEELRDALRAPIARLGFEVAGRHGKLKYRYVDATLAMLTRPLDGLSAVFVMPLITLFYLYVGLPLAYLAWFATLYIAVGFALFQLIEALGG